MRSGMLRTGRDFIVCAFGCPQASGAGNLVAPPDARTLVGPSVDHQQPGWQPALSSLRLRMPTSIRREGSEIAADGEELVVALAADGGGFERVELLERIGQGVAGLD